MTRHPRRAAHDVVELELIRSLAAGLLPTSIMTVGFAVCGGLILWTEQDQLLALLMVGALIASAARIVAALRMPRKDEPATISLARARRLEWNFRLGHHAFAAMLGLFGLRTFQLDSAALHMLMTCLLIGYAAGVSATTALRPRIAIPSMLLALMPPMIAAIARMEAPYVAMGLMTMAFVVGGIQNMCIRHTRTKEEIALRITFGNIARKDSLTALPNRIALREWFHERGMTSGRTGLIAVHYLDLDGFKPVNDRFGHLFGDALLAAVGQRIVGATRETDLAARLGGDEFAVVQVGIGEVGDAEQLARRLNAAISRPYQIDGRIVNIATSIGYVVVTPQQDRDLEQLLALADRALYASKRQGGGVTRYGGDTPEPARNIA